MNINITFGVPKEISEILKNVILLGENMSAFVENFKAELADVKAKIEGLNTVGESIKALVEAQTAHINQLAQAALDAPTAEEKDAILAGIQEVALSVNGEVEELQSLVQANTAAEGVA